LVTAHVDVSSTSGMPVLRRSPLTDTVTAQVPDPDGQAGAVAGATP